MARGMRMALVADALLGDASEVDHLTGEGATVAQVQRPLRSWFRRLGAFAAVGGAAAAVLVAVQKHRETKGFQGVMMDRFRKPFRLYEGELAMPSRADQYNGIWDNRPVTIENDQWGVTHVFAVGDWGATLPDHVTFGATGGDTNRQFDVASAMKNRAKWAKPQYVMNVGDNFYVEGLEHNCNTPPNDMQDATIASFSSGWQWMYGDVANIPWLSVLGNHDYGGWRFDKGWPQQIGYSFINHNWIMPARYYLKKMDHGYYTVDYYMIDSNAFDAVNIGEPGENVNHNICSKHNYEGSQSCAANGGMPNIQGCKDWFWNTFKVQKDWLTEQISKSDARWKVVISHFPCGYDVDYFKMLKQKHGLDLLVTGHRHQQELWKQDTKSRYIQAFLETNKWDGSAPTCFVTGGGGGIASENFPYGDYGGDLLQYGFFHVSFHQDWLKIESVGMDGVVHGNLTIHPHGTDMYAQESQKVYAPVYGGLCGSFCGDMNNPWEKVCGWGSEASQVCTQCTTCRQKRAPSVPVPSQVFVDSGPTHIPTTTTTETTTTVTTTSGTTTSSTASTTTTTTVTTTSSTKTHTTTTLTSTTTFSWLAPLPAPAAPIDCQAWCGNEFNPWTTVCPGGSSPMTWCSGCASCSAAQPPAEAKHHAKHHPAPAPVPTEQTPAPTPEIIVEKPAPPAITDVIVVETAAVPPATSAPSVVAVVTTPAPSVTEEPLATSAPSATEATSVTSSTPEIIVEKPALPAITDVIELETTAVPPATLAPSFVEVVTTPAPSESLDTSAPPVIAVPPVAAAPFGLAGFDTDAAIMPMPIYSPPPPPVLPIYTPPPPPPVLSVYTPPAMPVVPDVYCQVWCGNELSPWTLVCAWGTAPVQLCSSCSACKTQQPTRAAGKPKKTTVMAA